MTFYATPATGANWVVPKKYVEKVGEEGFKKAPVGAGPYRFVSSTPGIDLVLEAVDGYWRKTPSVKRLVFKSVPDPSTRLVMLKRGDTDVAYVLTGELGDEVQRTPGLTLAAHARSRARTGCSSPTSGTPARRGTTGACAWPPRMRSTVRRSTRPRAWASPRSPAASSRRSFDFYWQPPVRPLRPGDAPSSSSPRPAIPNGFDARRLLVRHLGVRDRRGGPQLPARRPGSG